MSARDSRWLLGPLYALIALAIIAGTVFLYPPLRQRVEDNFLASERAHVVVTVGESQFLAQRVSEAADMEKGLSGRQSLQQGYGMLFDFVDPQINVSFWMNNMKFPIDIIWIHGNRVVGIDKRVPNPEIGEVPVTRVSPGTISQVLEVNAGEAEGIQVGDRVIVTTR